MHAVDGPVESHPVGHLDTIDGRDLPGANTLAHGKAATRSPLAGTGGGNRRVDSDRSIHEQVAALIGDIDDDARVAAGAL